jgi:hypothetical protein
MIGNTQMAGLDEFRSHWTTSRNCARRTSGSPGDHASPRFPPEPPSLACLTPKGRAAAAEGASASPWWTRASAVLERFAPWLFEKVPHDELRAHMVAQRSRNSQHGARMHREAGPLNEHMSSEAACQIRPTRTVESGSTGHQPTTPNAVNIAKSAGTRPT